MRLKKSGKDLSDVGVSILLVVELAFEGRIFVYRGLKPIVSILLVVELAFEVINCHITRPLGPVSILLVVELAFEE